MDLIDIKIMKLSYNFATIKDFIAALEACEKAGKSIDHVVVNGNTFYIPEEEYACDFDELPKSWNHEKMGSEATPVICTASGENYIVIKASGSDFMLDQFTTITAVLLGLRESFSDVRILDSIFKDDTSVYLVRFNGNSDN